jgi:hypothetical protein
MAKGQRRSNREVKKPKQAKSKNASLALPLVAPEAGPAKGPRSREMLRR